jgi:hypothetical protein
MDESIEWITRKQARDMIGCSLRTVDHMLTDGRLTKYLDGMGRIWIHPDEIRDLVTPVPVVNSANR